VLRDGPQKVLIFMTLFGRKGSSDRRKEKHRIISCLFLMVYEPRAYGCS